jgi:hypothetical protein
MRHYLILIISHFYLKLILRQYNLTDFSENVIKVYKIKIARFLETSYLDCHFNNMQQFVATRR